MTVNDFVGRLFSVAVFTVALAALLRFGFGPRWFAFYGWATVALAAGVAVTWLLWKRLPAAGRSRWWALLLGLPVCLAALVQIGFWFLFFSRGPTNPMFGVLREMLRPWIEAGQPFALAVVLAGGLWLMLTASRSAARG